jgi:acyl carrier protein
MGFFVVGAKEIENCLASIGVLPDGVAVLADDSLFDLGIIDSLGIMMLVSELEAQFKIQVPEYDLLPDNFDTINAIAGYVNKRRHHKAAAS